MLPPQALLAAMLFFQFFRSGVTSSTQVSLPTLPTVRPSSSSTAASLQTNSRNSIMMTSTVTPSATQDVSSTSVATADVSSTTVTEGGQGEWSLSPTKSRASSVNQTASVSIAYIMWSSWREEKESDCQVKCCDTRGPVIRQIRNCTILKPPCEALVKCTDYGATERDISCYTACECMRNAGNTGDVAVVFIIITNILGIAILMTGP